LFLGVPRLAASACPALAAHLGSLRIGLAGFAIFRLDLRNADV
jgi:hypothetical protein